MFVGRKRYFWYKLYKILYNMSSNKIEILEKLNKNQIYILICKFCFEKYIFLKNCSKKIII